MKLTKQLLLKRLRPVLLDRGYSELNNKHVLFCKKVDNFFFLCISPTIHRYYDDLFTIDYYLSNILSVNCTFGDIPSDCETRPGFLLSKEERCRRYGSSICDIWWHCFDDASFSDFCEILLLTEPRMLVRRYNLKPKLISSYEDARMVNDIRGTIELVSEKVDELNGDYIFTPRNLENIPLIWYNAAESYLQTIGKDTKFSVPFLAKMAYYHFIMGEPNNSL